MFFLFSEKTKIARSEKKHRKPSFLLSSSLSCYPFSAPRAVSELRRHSVNFSTKNNRFEGQRNVAIKFQSGIFTEILRKMQCFFFFAVSRLESLDSKCTKFGVPNGKKLERCKGVQMLYISKKAAKKAFSSCKNPLGYSLERNFQTLGNQPKPTFPPYP